MSESMRAAQAKDFLNQCKISREEVIAHCSSIGAYSDKMLFPVSESVYGVKVVCVVYIPLQQPDMKSPEYIVEAVSMVSNRGYSMDITQLMKMTGGTNHIKQQIRGEVMRRWQLRSQQLLSSQAKALAKAKGGCPSREQRNQVSAK